MLRFQSSILSSDGAVKNVLESASLVLSRSHDGFWLTNAHNKCIPIFDDPYIPASKIFISSIPLNMQLCCLCNNSHIFSAGPRAACLPRQKICPWTLEVAWDSDFRIWSQARRLLALISFFVCGFRLLSSNNHWWGLAALCMKCDGKHESMGLSKRDPQNSRG